MKIILLFFLIIWVKQSFSFVTLESVLLGTNQDYQENSFDSLKYLLELDKVNVKEKENALIKRYYQFYLEGTKLNKSCGRVEKTSYGSINEENIAKSSIVATLQYISLNLLVNAIAQYARYFDFTKEEYGNLVERLIGNYCSRNVSIISRDKLRSNFFFYFNKQKWDIVVPTFSQYSFFSNEITSLLSDREVLRLQFLHSVKVFRAFCSWGGDYSNLRLIYPFLRNPVLMSFVFRQLSQKKLEWDQKLQKIKKISSSDTTQILCSKSICRRLDHQSFKNLFPKSLGAMNLKKDFERLYCYYFKNAKKKISDQEEQILDWMKVMSHKDEKLMNLYLTSLITGIPSFSTSIESVEDLRDILRSSIQSEWNYWSDQMGERFSNYLYYENSVTIEKSSERLDIKKHGTDYYLSFDINLGEYDRAVQRVGKLEVSKEIVIKESFFMWFMKVFRGYRYTEKYRKNLIDSMKKQIDVQLKKMFNKFEILPWKGDLSGLIVDFLIAKTKSLTEVSFKSNSRENFTIHLHFHYSLHALKYFHFRFRKNSLQRSGKL